MSVIQLQDVPYSSTSTLHVLRNGKAFHIRHKTTLAHILISIVHYHVSNKNLIFCAHNDNKITQNYYLLFREP